MRPIGIGPGETVRALIVLGLLIAPGAVGWSAEGARQAEQWRILEVAFQAQRNKDTPPKDLTLDVTFSAGEEKIERPAFWDGGAAWKVRFAPPKTGTWSYRTQCSDPHDAGLHGKTGELVCVPYKGDHPNFAHGFLKVGPTRRRLVYEDGTPFFWLGDTHWSGPNLERVDTCNEPGHNGQPCPHGGQFQHLVQDRKAKGFNVYQLYPSVTSDVYWASKFDRLNIEHFQKQVDAMMDYLADQGFVIAMGLGHWSAPDKVGLDVLKLWTRAFVARYGAHPVVWITAQEADMNPKVGAGWSAVAQELRRLDGYRHPLSYHQRWGPHTTWWKETWHDWGCTQGGHRNVRLRSKKDYQAFWTFAPPKPWVEGEHMYEQLKACGGPHQASDARNAAWKATLCGSMGYTYGGAGVWLPGWDAAAVKKSSWIDLTWYEGMKLPGSAQMAHYKKFFTSLEHWDQLVPRFNDPAWAQWAQPEQSVLASVDNKTFVAYFYGGGADTGTLKNLGAKTAYSARWFNPRDGTYASIAEKLEPKDCAWAVPPRPDNQDWVLLVQAAASSGSEQ